MDFARSTAELRDELEEWRASALDAADQVLNDKTRSALTRIRPGIRFPNTTTPLDRAFSNARTGQLFLATGRRQAARSTSKAESPRLEHRFENHFAGHFRLPGATIGEGDWNFGDSQTGAVGPENRFHLKRITFRGDTGSQNLLQCVASVTTKTTRAVPHG